MPFISRISTGYQGYTNSDNRRRRSIIIPPSPPVDFSSFTFTTAGKTGRTGPSLAELRASYDIVTYPWLLDNDEFNMLTNGIQLWTVPATGTYRITARGAQGSTPDGTRGGRGAVMTGDFNLTAGEKIQILVGQTAPTGNASRIDKSSPGGGGSFVVKYTGITNVVADILVIAGGGGGTGSDRPSGADALTTTSGAAGRNGAGGTNGNGGSNSGATTSCGPGGGFLTNGASANSAQGLSFLNGGLGGIVNATYSTVGGGFGGGGSVTNGLLFRYAGGGGYSGGGSSGTFGNLDGTGDTTGYWGGGGGSYNAGSNQTNLNGNSGNTGAGSVVIQLL